MIFTTVGSQKYAFDRLVQAVDSLARTMQKDENFFIQIGSSEYIPKYAEYSRYIDSRTYEKKISECSVLITQASAGTMFGGLKKGKKIIAIPRLHEYGEHIDDHQKELGRALSERGYLIYLEDLNGLESSLSKIDQIKLKSYNCNNNHLIGVIEKCLPTK